MRGTNTRVGPLRRLWLLVQAMAAPRRTTLAMVRAWAVSRQMLEAAELRAEGLTERLEATEATIARQRDKLAEVEQALRIEQAEKAVLLRQLELSAASEQVRMERDRYLAHSYAIRRGLPPNDQHADAV